MADGVSVRPARSAANDSSFQPPSTRAEPAIGEEGIRLPIYAAPGSKALSQDGFHHLAVDVRQSMVPALKLVRQPGVFDAQAVQERGVQVVDVHRSFGDVVAIVVGF